MIDETVDDQNSYSSLLEMLDVFFPELAGELPRMYDEFERRDLMSTLIEDLYEDEEGREKVVDAVNKRLNENQAVVEEILRDEEAFADARATFEDVMQWYRWLAEECEYDSFDLQELVLRDNLTFYRDMQFA